MQPGYIIASRYLLVQELGRGGTSTVWVALDSQRQIRVAVKMLRPELLPDSIVSDRFDLEVRALRKATSPHIVRVLASGQDPVVGPFLVMDLLEGETLENRLARQGTLNGASFCRMAHDVAEALCDIHALGLVHRDLKPSNVFLSRESGREVVKLLDFGTVKVLRAVAKHGLTGEKDLVGTLSRMSPEQVSNRKVDARCDIWAFAMLTFEALVGMPAIDGRMPAGQVVMAIYLRRLPVPSQFNAALDERFDAWFAKSTALEPSSRFRSAREQMDALQQILSPEPGEPLARIGKVTVRVRQTLSLPPLVLRSRFLVPGGKTRQTLRPMIRSAVAADDKE